MIRVRFLACFDDSLRRFVPKERVRAESALRRLLAYFSGGAKPLGLGLRKLRGDYWEIRFGLDKRAIFSLRGGLAVFVLAGSHDEIRRFLRRF